MRPRVDPAAVLALVVVLGGSACEAKQPAPEPEPEPIATEQVVLAPVFQGERVTLPPQFVGLVFGMTKAEAEALVPSMDEQGRIPMDPRRRETLSAHFARATGTLDRLEVFAPKIDVVTHLTELWGPPRERTDLGNKSRWWFNPDAGLRARVPGYGDEPARTVEFTHYQPLAQFLGEGPELAFQSKHPLLGMTPTELDAAYGEGLTPHFRAEIREHGDEADASVVRMFPPTDWDSETHVSLAWQDHRIVGLILRLPYPDDPAGKAELMALLVKKWGETTERDDSTRVFSKYPHIQVEDDPESQYWQVTVSR
jgi:hypothetical protein